MAASMQLLTETCAPTLTDHVAIVTSVAVLTLRIEGSGDDRGFLSSMAC
jgi:hypothetical protein